MFLGGITAAALAASASIQQTVQTKLTHAIASDAIMDMFVYSYAATRSVGVQASGESARRLAAFNTTLI